MELQSAKVAEAVRDCLVVAVAGGAALDNAFAGNRRDPGMILLVALFSARAVGFGGFT